MLKQEVEKLEQMIKDNAPYDEIVIQSQVVDKYIIEQMRKLNS